MGWLSCKVFCPEEFGEIQGDQIGGEFLRSHPSGPPDDKTSDQFACCGNRQGRLHRQRSHDNRDTTHEPPKAPWGLFKAASWGLPPLRPPRLVLGSTRPAGGDAAPQTRRFILGGSPPTSRLGGCRPPDSPICLGAPPPDPPRRIRDRDTTHEPKQSALGPSKRFKILLKHF